MIACIAIAMFTMTGCKTFRSYTFNIETGEKIKVKLNTSSGEKLKNKKGRFVIVNEADETISIGVFFLPERIDVMFKSISTAKGAEIIEEGAKDGFNYVFYKYTFEDGKVEWNYLTRQAGAKAGIVVTNSISEESAAKVLDLVEFEYNPD